MSLLMFIIMTPNEDAVLTCGCHHFRWEPPHRADTTEVGDEVSKDEPITTNPNVGGFGQAGNDSQ